MAMLALKPPMGWNAWNFFGYRDVNEQVIKETADAMVELGFRDAGYTIVAVDDSWMCVERDADGNLQADPVRFPSGMKALGDYIHERGLKFGLYAGGGVLTYCGRAGTFGHERQDAKKFAEWGVDLLKYDFGYPAPGHDEKQLYRKMGQALRESGRDIIFSACLGRRTVSEWMKSCGANMWRLCGDIKDSWESIVNVAMNAIGLEAYAGHGAWNDPDMMVVGLFGEGYVGKIGGGCTVNEYEAHFALWCMLSAPLMMGHDVRNTRPEILNILLNKELIDINQDDLGLAAFRIPELACNDVVLAKPLYGGDIAFLLLNQFDHPKKIPLSWYYCGWEVNDKIMLRDVIAHEDLGVFQGGICPEVKPHSVKVYRARRI
ncbi:MAG TPA: glycoside hydrolase family 27 protein [Bacillota bacterium]|nr:glycoside hydrolase family 27 protein [Bacillota bacterium]HOK68810.1 glycoside hydrolase family 27 protein [Bacillota bacterium]HPP84883.1 glycoside hydrolase family 27 protein [Bacillota bacterium]